MAPRSEGLFETLAGLAAVGTLPAGILAALFLGLTEAAVVFVVGWLLLVPVFGVLDDAVGSDDESASERNEASVEGDDPLEALKARYARGEIDEAEFEARLERLVAADEIPPEAVESNVGSSPDDPVSVPESDDLLSDTGTSDPDEERDTARET